MAGLPLFTRDHSIWYLMFMLPISLQLIITPSGCDPPNPLDPGGLFAYEAGFWGVRALNCAQGDGRLAAVRPRSLFPFSCASGFLAAIGFDGVADITHLPWVIVNDLERRGYGPDLCELNRFVTRFAPLPGRCF